MAEQRTSSIPIVKAALITTFAEATKTEGRDGKPLPVYYGSDTTERVDEFIVVGGTTAPAQQTWAPLGNRRREEDYALEVWIETAGQKRQKEATERAFAILAFCEVALRADPSAGINQGITDGTVPFFEHLALEVATADLEEAPQPDGRGFWARVGWAVHVESRI